MLETNHDTPYFLNLHYRDVAHTLVLGRTGSGKSFLLNFLITNLQKYAPHTFIFDLGGSFESLTKLFDGGYVSVGVESRGFSINPFSLAPTKENLDFLTLFVKVLAGDGRIRSGQPSGRSTSRLKTSTPWTRRCGLWACSRTRCPTPCRSGLPGGLAEGSSDFFSTIRKTLSRFPRSSASTFSG